MTIVNGTFDTDLTGWIYSPTKTRPNVGGTYTSVFWDNGKAHLYNTGAQGFYGCGDTVFLYQKFNIDNKIISFDYSTSVNVYPYAKTNYFVWTLIVHVPVADPITGITTIIDKTVVDNELIPNNQSGIIYKDVSQYIGMDTTISFYVTGGVCNPKISTFCQCNSPTLTLDNIILSPNWGTFRISSIPGKANIFIDDSFVNITPDTGSIDLPNIVPGSHNVKLQKTDYYDYSQTIDVFPGRIYEISDTLMPQVGCLNIFSDPIGAEIYLSDRNGKILTDIGFTTFKQICDLFWGDYKWKLVKPGYEPKNGIAHIIDATGATISETLTFIDIGCIYFETNPPGAEIILDGNDTHLVTPNKICNLPLGQHCYELILPGYITISDCVTLTSTSGEAVSTDLVQSALTTIDVSPSVTSITIGNTQQFTATCKDQNNTVMTCPTITWSVTDTTLGNIDPTGKFTASSANTGTVTVTAMSGTVSGTAIATVTSIAQVLTSIDISPSVTSITIGNTQQFTATCKDQNNTVMTCPTITWSVTDTTLGNIDPTGKFTASSTNTGSATVTATSETVVGSAIVTVTAVPPVQAGFGGIGMFLIAGLAVGYILYSKRKDESITGSKD